MQKFLNLTLPLKQDEASQAGLMRLLDGFKTQSLTADVEHALTGAETVHFARFMLIGTQFIQIITTFDGDEMEYAEFFWKKLNPVFKAAYEFIEGAPTGPDWTLDNFHAFNALHQPVPFFRFSAYPDKTVQEINNLNSPGPAAAHPALSSNGSVAATMRPQGHESAPASPVISSETAVAAPVRLPELGNIQGLIVRAYTRTYSRHLLLNIKDAAGRKLLNDLSPMVTSAETWPENRPWPNRLLNLGITYNGLKALRVDPKIVDGMANNINGFPLEFRKSGGKNPDFSGSAGFTGDSDPCQWWAKAERSFTSADIHLILHLYNRDADDLKPFTEEIRALLSKHQVEELKPMAGGETIDSWRGSEKKDHFGYRDGISQPNINWPGINDGPYDADFRDFLLGYANDAYQSAPTGDFARDGSYLVFQLIYQDVAYFNRFLKSEERNLPALLGISDRQEWLAAKLVGRWRSGSPLVKSPLIAGENPEDNDFGYSGDPQGHGCPFSAHIRIGNPRDQMINPTARPAPRLIRRGTPYGKPLEGDVDDDVDRGLIGLFICASIARQYLRISRWINRNDFSPVISDKTAQDPIQGNRGVVNASRNFRIPMPDQDLVLQGLRSFVRTTGAVYCFLPSLQTIKDLGEGKYRKP